MGVESRPKERVSLWISLVSATMGLKANIGVGVGWWFGGLESPVPVSKILLELLNYLLI
jgi:hypothetical protein